MDIKLIHKIENASIKFNMGSFFTKKIGTGSSLILLNKNLPTDPYLNYATKINVRSDVEKFLDNAESIFKSFGVVPSFYLLPYTVPKNFENILKKRGYKLFGNDAWMLFDLSKNVTEITGIRKIQSKEFSQFKDVFNEVFTKGEPGDPYQGLSPLYGKFLQTRFNRKSQDFKVESYGAFVENQLVGTCEMVHDKEIAGIYALAVLPEFRNKGFGKGLLAKCVKRCQELKIKHLFLWTEVGSRNEKIFKKFGFRTKVIGKQLYKTNS